jgi:hypothetical protein
MARVNVVAGSGMTLGALHHKLREENIVVGSGWHRGLEDGASVVGSITNSGQGRWRHVKGLDHGRER